MARNKFKKLPSRQEDFSAWYNEVIFQGKLVDASPTRGCVVLRPYGYSIWEHIQKKLDKKFKACGVENAYFPLLIPQSFITKEADHIEGFAPELAVVTHAGGKKLEEPYVVRPTSETMIYHMFARWIRSWRDLPLKINQWANVVRWEMRTRPFLRTTEFLWQEGHTAHATKQEALDVVKQMLQVYVSFIQEELCIPLFPGIKTEKERFGGAEQTYCIEAIMPDGKALQMGTSHLLAESFPASHEVQFQNADGQMQTPWCTSWGVTTRMIGALIMEHGDDNGLVLPPRVAPYQVVIVPIYRNDEDKKICLDAARVYADYLQGVGIRVHVDTSDDRPGAKFFGWELRGVPLRVELGAEEVKQKQVVLVPRIPLEGIDKKESVLGDSLVDYALVLLDKIQREIQKRAQRMVAELEMPETSLAGFGAKMAEKGGYVRTGWCQDRACEDKLDPFKAGIRCILDEEIENDAGCFGCDARAQVRVIVAKGY